MPTASSATLTALAVAGFGAAFLHAAIPTHWLPFVLVGRARRWSRRKTLSVALLAGAGHVAANTALGAAIAWFGARLGEESLELLPWAVGGLLVVIGLWFCWRQWRGGGLCHHHPPGGRHQPSNGCGHGHEHSHWDEELRESALAAPATGDWAVIGGLLAMLTLSPCEAFLPVYLLGVPFGVHGFLVLSAILAVATLGAMALFTWLTLLGFERFRLQNLERREAGLLGAIFVTLGVLVVALELLGWA
jgi:nickel/cobalt exporter